jgi:hypothetical protein
MGHRKKKKKKKKWWYIFIKIDGITVNDHPYIANIFNSYFSTVTDRISVNNPTNTNTTSNAAHPLSYLYQVFTKHFQV